MVEMELNWNWKHFTIFGKLKVKMVHLTSFWYLEKTAYICEMNIVGWIRGSYTDTTLRYTLNTVTERQLNIFWAKKNTNKWSLWRYPRDKKMTTRHRDRAIHKNIKVFVAGVQHTPIQSTAMCNVVNFLLLFAAFQLNENHLRDIWLSQIT